jgi:putative transposase
MRTVSAASVAAGQERIEGVPASVQEALGELASAAKEGLLALSVGVGLGVLHELMEAEVDVVVGPKGRHDRDRAAVRHGHERGEVTLGGRRVPVERPRARMADGEHEVELGSYAHFAARDRLTDVMLERMLAGVSTRRYACTGEPVGSEIDQVSRSTSKSAVSREFVSRTREHLIDLMSRPLDELRLAVVMLDGIDLKGRCCVVALGIDTDGVKHPLGLWDGSTENATVATTLLVNLVERGLDVEQGVLVVIDGAKALRKAVRDVFGTDTPVQRCVRHKERNVLGHLPERDRPLVRRRLRAAWALEDHDRALDQLRVLALRARPLAPRRRRVAARGPRGDADRHPPRCPWPPQAHARLDEPVRVDDRHRPTRCAQRQALAERRHVPALDRRRHARSRSPVPQDHRLPRSRQARRRGRVRSRRQARGQRPHDDRSQANRDRGAGGRRFTRLR